MPGGKIRVRNKDERDIDILILKSCRKSQRMMRGLQTNIKAWFGSATTFLFAFNKKTLCRGCDDK